MNNLFKSILGKYPNCQLRVQHSMPDTLSDTMIPPTSMKEEFFRHMAYHLATELLAKKATTFVSGPDPDNRAILYEAAVYAFSDTELEQVLSEIFQAGADSANII